GAQKTKMRAEGPAAERTSSPARRGAGKATRGGEAHARSLRGLSQTSDECLTAPQQQACDDHAEAEEDQKDDNAALVASLECCEVRPVLVIAHSPECADAGPGRSGFCLDPVCPARVVLVLDGLTSSVAGGPGTDDPPGCQLR